MNDWHPRTPLALAVFAAGFEYDATLDAIKSRMHAWQRAMGFNWLYDAAAPRMLMILDCEPFYFTSRGKRWLIELWKGQYGLETGCEIGVYTAPDLTAPLGAADGASAGRGAVPRLANARTTVHNAIHTASRLYQDPRHGHYLGASNNDLLRMSFTLRRNGTVLLRRGPEFHWWLTAFKWGVFTKHTTQLTMDVEITLLDDEMYESFRAAVVATGYQVLDKGNLKLGFTFGAPKTQQPPSRGENEDAAQEINAQLVADYCQLQKDLKLPSNDPNGFDMLTIGAYVAPKAVHHVTQTVKHVEKQVLKKIDTQVLKKIERAAPLASRTVHRAAEVVRKPDHDVADARATVCQDLIQFFGRGWHTSGPVPKGA